MGSAKKTVELFYDVVSPYSWIAFEVLTRYQTRWAMNLKFRPFLLTGVMDGADNRPPGMVSNKVRYTAMYDIPLLAKHYAIPIQTCSNPAEDVFAPGASLPAMRFLTALSMRAPDKVEEMSRQLWLRLWSRDKPINQAEHIAEAGKAAGLDDVMIQELLQQTTSQEIKDKLKQTTDEALKHGAFGAPLIIAHDANNKKQMLFGSDRIHILADVIGEKYEGPLAELGKAKS